MNKLYEELGDRIRGDAPELDRLVQRSLLLWISMAPIRDLN